MIDSLCLTVEAFDLLACDLYFGHFLPLLSILYYRYDKYSCHKIIINGR